jgi:GNAT superfamily N-acetyltransferase
MGFDLHTHPPSRACDRSCIAHQGGRRTQLAAQLSVLENRADGFFIQKAIDGAPRVNGSQLVMAQRVATFIWRPFHRQFYYEALPDARQAQRLFVESLNWYASLGVPRAHIDHVHIAVKAFRSWYTAPNGRILMPSPGDPSIGLHAVLLTHYSDSGGTLGFVNSWGPNWGERGYGTMPFEYLERYFFDAIVTRRARWGPMSWTFHGCHDHSPREIRRRFAIENPRFRGKVRVASGENWQTCVYDTLSPWTDKDVVCVEVANGFGLKMGWAFFRNLSSAGTNVLEVPELFVWPTFRRMGVGRILNEYAEGYAQMWRCSEIRLMMNEADAVVGPPRAAARLFGQACGYQWTWRQEVAPRRTATGSKQI